MGATEGNANSFYLSSGQFFFDQSKGARKKWILRSFRHNRKEVKEKGLGVTEKRRLHNRMYSSVVKMNRDLLFRQGVFTQEIEMSL